MEPTLLNGDHIFVDRRQTAKSPHRGDLIVFNFSGAPKIEMIKRVVAVEGDTVEIRNKVLIVNGKTITEPYAAYNQPYTIPANQSPRDNFGPHIIPASSYFVMGDNRDRSYDSRFWGVVPRDNIKGTVKSIYWSWDPQGLSTRWERVGMNVLKPNSKHQQTSYRVLTPL